MRRERKVYSYQIDLMPEEGGGYTVVVPALSGCVSHGETIEEATRNAREAIELHLENLAAHHEPIPASHRDLRSRSSRLAKHTGVAISV
jgi:predicted RNase H-like HicB family nuclease